MKSFEIYIAYVAWESDGKRRPILVLADEDKHVAALRITTQFDNKGRQIRSKYMKIVEWDYAGLKQPSYIDTWEYIRVSKNLVDKAPIGKLSAKDKLSLEKMLNGDS